MNFRNTQTWLFLLSFLKQTSVELGYLSPSSSSLCPFIPRSTATGFCFHCSSKTAFSTLTDDTAQCKEHFALFFPYPSRIFDIEYSLSELLLLFSNLSLSSGSPPPPSSSLSPCPSPIFLSLCVPKMLIFTQDSGFDFLHPKPSLLVILSTLLPLINLHICSRFLF